MMEFVWGALALGFADTYALPYLLGFVVKLLPASIQPSIPAPAAPSTLTAGIYNIVARGAVLALTVWALRMLLGERQLEEA